MKGNIMQELWNKLTESVKNSYDKMTFLMVGLETISSGKVSENKDSEPIKFRLQIDWSKCSFHHLVNLATQTVRIQTQSKMRKDSMPTENQLVEVSITEKQTKTVSVGSVVNAFDKLSEEQKQQFLDQMKAIAK